MGASYTHRAVFREDPKGTPHLQSCSAKACSGGRQELCVLGGFAGSFRDLEHVLAFALGRRFWTSEVTTLNSGSCTFVLVKSAARRA